MKVVIFCGGLGTRILPYVETLPKPMVPIGLRPIIWHLMKYYAYFGHNEFILALGHKSNTIKDFFLNYKEEDSNDFVFSEAGKNIELLSLDISDWKITFIDTGTDSNIGTRLFKVKNELKDEEMFLANYADGLTDLNLPIMIDNFLKNKDAIGSFMTYKPNLSLHWVDSDKQNKVTGMKSFKDSNLSINAGYFVFKKEIFDYINYGEDLVEEPFERLIKKKKLICLKHNGFWKALDTFKDKIEFDKILKQGNGPWEVWKD